AQQKESTDIERTGTPFGFYLKIKNPASGYEILRKEPGSSYQTIGNYIPVMTASDLYRRMTTYVGIFPNYGSPQTAFVDTIWNRYQTDQSSLSQIPYPLLQLSLGNAFLDTSAVLGKTYRYKIMFSEIESELESPAVVYELN